MVNVLTSVVEFICILATISVAVVGLVVIVIAIIILERVVNLVGRHVMKILTVLLVPEQRQEHQLAVLVVHAV